MDRSNSSNHAEELDLDLIAQQIQTLAEMAAREHMESLQRSQAKGLVELSRNTAHIKSAGNWRG